MPTFTCSESHQATHTPRSGRPRHSLLALVLLGAGTAAGVAAGPDTLLPGANVNMVSGITWPDGDPFLQRQNEPSIAVSTRNPLHLLAGANDYRTVDIPHVAGSRETGDSWLGVFKSGDGGGSWQSTLIPCYPQSLPEDCADSPIYEYQAAADPVVRAGTHGLFYYSGIVFDRGFPARSAAFVARFMDLNNDTADPIRYIDTVEVDQNGGDAFIDKTWLEVDIPRTGAQTVTLQVPQGGGVVPQTVACGNVYMAWAAISGQGPSLRTRIMWSRSQDCGTTWSAPIALSVSNTVGQGATIAVAPSTGRVYVAWRQFKNATLDCVPGGLGYWKNCGSWPVASLVMGGVTSTKAQALAVLNKAPGGDATYILAHQLIPAKLNTLSGAVNSAISAVIVQADAWLQAHPLGSKPGQPAKNLGLALKNQLEAFNQGTAGPGPCTAAATPSADAILVVRSDNGGQTFTSPLQVATLSPFDQGTTEMSFRTNAYPTMTVDATGRAYLAWATRGLATPNSNSLTGDSRIVVTTSSAGTTWSTPRAIDQPVLPGHQLAPSLTFNAGKLLLVYNDFRADAAQVFERFVVDVPGRPARHTVDIRAAVADPAAAPVFTNYSILAPSSQVSRYPFIVTGAGAADAASRQIQWNPPNLPMFENGTKPFFSDYLDVAGAPRFVPNGGGAWTYNTAPSTAPVFHAAWTDNRDVGPPADGISWANYVPPSPGGESKFDPGQQRAACDPDTDAGFTQMRNQNIYTSRMTRGLFVAVPSNARPLSSTFGRAFVVFVQNATASPKTFRIEILNQPTGGTASLEQFAPATQAFADIGAYSSVSRTVFVTSGVPSASVDVRVQEWAASSPVTGGLVSTVRINGDATNPPPADATLLARETYNPAVLNPAAYNPAIYNPAVFNTDIFNPAVFNPAVFNPAVFNDSVLNYDPANPAVFNPAVLNPAVFNPAVFNTDAFNLAVMSLALLNPAVYNPAVFNPAVFNPAVFNPAVFNPAVLNPAVLNPAVFNPAVFNPAVLNPAVFNPAVFNTTSSDGSVTEANFLARNEGTATSAYSLNLRLSDQQPGLLYQLIIYRLYFVPVANGCTLTSAAQQELLVNDLHPNLNASLLDPKGGATFYLNPGETAIATLRIIPDPSAPVPGNPALFNMEDLSASVVPAAVNTVAAAIGETQPAFAALAAPSLPTLAITTASLPDGVLGSPYPPTLLVATGGSGPRTWSIAPGSTLPPGLTLSAAGLLSGTPTGAGSFAAKFRVADETQIAERSLSLTVTLGPSPVTSLIIINQPSIGTAGQAMSTLQVVARDSTSSPLPGVSVTITIGASPCVGAALSGGTVLVTGATGQALFNTLSIDRGGYGYMLLATATASPSVGTLSAPIQVEGFCATGSMSTARTNHTATLLNGMAFVAGGVTTGGLPTPSVELYDPDDNAFASTVSMGTARSLHTATLLSEGNILIAGGVDGSFSALATAEVYDRGSGSFRPAGTMSAGRLNHTATLLPGGYVLVVGGSDSPMTAQLFDPDSETFGPTGGLNAPRANHTATLLPNGRVLITGSDQDGVLASAEIYDPIAGTFAFTTEDMGTARLDHTATLLADGRVLVTGGFDGTTTVATAEIYDPVLGTFSPISDMNGARRLHQATVLPNGKVLISGGATVGIVPSSELFDPASSSFSFTGSLTTPRALHTATKLDDGKVLIVGGGSSTILTSAELYLPEL